MIKQINEGDGTNLLFQLINVGGRKTSLKETTLKASQ